MDAKEGSNNFLKGILVGATSWVPGMSGGIVAVILGVYERLIDDITHFRTKIKEDFWFLATLLTGILVGLLVIVYVIKYAIDGFPVPTMFLFAGLIIGQLPDLMRITKRNEPMKASHTVWMALGLIVMTILLLLRIMYPDEDPIANSDLLIGVLLSFLVGAIFAISKIIPGISGATVLVVLGLYTWMNDIISGFDLLYLIPFGIGFVAAVFLFAKVMWYIIEKHHHRLYYFVTGLTVGSIMFILVYTMIEYGFATMDILMGCAAAAIGIIISLAFSRLRKPAQN
jgi:putative membrane protein